MNETRKLPIFHLRRVLFPKMVLPLHVFEERNRALVEYCRENQQPFGIIPEDDLRQGTVGTLATIYKIVKEYKNGRYDLLALGEQRFQFKRIIDGDAFPKAEVQLITEDEGVRPQEREVRDLLNLYWGFIAHLGLKPDQRRRLEEVVSKLDAEQEIAYIIGQTIGMDINRQRQLLAETSAAGRIERLTIELKRLITLQHLARQMFEETDFDPVLN